MATSAPISATLLLRRTRRGLARRRVFIVGLGARLFGVISGIAGREEVIERAAQRRLVQHAGLGGGRLRLFDFLRRGRHAQQRRLGQAHRRDLGGRRRGEELAGGLAHLGADEAGQLLERILLRPDGRTRHPQPLLELVEIDLV